MLLALALLLQDGFAPADVKSLPFSISLPPGYVIESQGVTDYMTWRVRNGATPVLTIRGGILAVPMLGMENQKGPVRQLRNCKDGALVNRTVLLSVPLGDESLLVTTAPGRGDADSVLTSLAIPGKHGGVKRGELLTCQL